MIALLLATIALASEVHVVRPGETVESLAGRLGDPALATEIRQMNVIAPGAQPAVGQALALPPRPDGADQPAQILAVVGTGSLRAPGAEPIGLVEGALLPPGTQVCTGDESFATVRLASSPGCGDEDDLTLLPGTCLVVTGNYAHPGRRTTLLDVARGTVTVRDGDQRGLVVVRTPSGTAQGTQGGFRVEAEAAAMRAEAVTRGIAIAGAGVERPLAAGFGARTQQGQAPGEPVALLPAPGPTTPLPDAPLHVPDFTWTGVERALGYRVELAADADFSKMLRRAEVGRLVWQPTTLFLPYRVPELYWRVVGFDRLGFEGIPSAPRRLRFPRGIEAGDAP